MVSDSIRKLFLSIQLLLHPGSLTAGLTRSRAGAKTTEGSGLDSLRVYYRKLLQMHWSQDCLEARRLSSRVAAIHTMLETLNAAQVLRSLITVCRALPLVHNGSAAYCPPQARPGQFTGHIGVRDSFTHF